MDLDLLMTLLTARKCLEEALQSYHSVESHFQDVLLSLSMKKREWLLALRAVTSKPLSYFLQQQSLILEDHRPDYGLREKYDGPVSPGLSDIFQWRVSLPV